MEVEVKSNTKRQLVVEFQMQQWCIVTLSLPRPCLWPPERVSARSPPASTWECSDSAPIFLNISFFYSSWECSILRLSFTYYFSILRARPTFLTRSMPFSFSCPSINLCMCLSFLNQSFPFSLLHILPIKSIFPIRHNHDLRQHCILTHLHILILLLSISIFCFHSHRSIWSRPAYDIKFLSSRQLY